MKAETIKTNALKIEAAHNDRESEMVKRLPNSVDHIVFTGNYRTRKINHNPA